MSAEDATEDLTFNPTAVRLVNGVRYKVPSHSLPGSARVALATGIRFDDLLNRLCGYCSSHCLVLQLATRPNALELLFLTLTLLACVLGGQARGVPPCCRERVDDDQRRSQFAALRRGGRRRHSGGDYRRSHSLYQQVMSPPQIIQKYLNKVDISDCEPTTHGMKQFILILHRCVEMTSTAARCLI